jgi:hypothetical protein
MAISHTAGASAAKQHRTTARGGAAFLAAAAAVALTLTAVAPASASTFGMRTAAASETPGAATKVCTVTATGYVKRGSTNVVTTTATSCGTTAVSRYAMTAAANVHVGYGCNGSSFTSTCWYFDVPSNGCATSSSWGWDTISQNNVLSSWEAVGTCSRGTLYDLPVYGGTRISCTTCYSLGSMNNLTSSLKVFR